MSRRSGLTSLLLALAVVGCQGRLQPAPGAAVLPERGGAAFAQSDGVRIVAEANAWRGTPSDLGGLIVPLLVTIENVGTVPLRLRYDAFALVGPDGTRFAALPPFDIRGTVSVPVDRYFHPSWTGFAVAPHLSSHYPGWSVFRGPFPYEPWYYDRYHPAFQRVALPTGDMVQKALPEGVLEPGGRVAGFLYFEGFPGTVPRVEFRAELVDARTASPFGTLTIPFVVG